MRCVVARLAFLIVVVVVINPTARAADVVTTDVVGEPIEEPAFMDVVLNGMWQGQFLMLVGGGEILMAERDYQTLRIGLPLPEALVDREGTAHVRLTAMSDVLTFELSETEAVVRLSVQPEKLAPSTFGFSRISKRGARERAAPFSFLLNYGVGGRWKDVALQSVTTSQDAAIAIHGVRLEFAGSSYQSVADARYNRGQTRMIWEFPEKLLRVVLWDDTIWPARFGMGGVIGGLGISNDFAMDPYLQTDPAYRFSALSSWVSELALRVNDHVVDQGRIRAGPYVLEDIPLVPGSNEIAVLLTDPRGREQLFEYRVFRGSNLLAPGLHAFDYHVGFQRRYGGNFDYSASPVLVGTHDFGVTNELTAGAHIELGAPGLQINPHVLWALDPLGMLDVAVAVSRIHDATGLGLAVSLSALDWNKWPLSIGTAVTTGTLRSLSSPDATRTARVNSFVGTAMPLAYGHTVAARVTHDWRERGGHRVDGALTYHASLWRGGQIGARLSLQWYERHNLLAGSLSVSVSHTFPCGVSTSYGAGLSDSSTESPQIMQNFGIGTPLPSIWGSGPSAGVNASMRGTSFASGAASLSWMTPLANLQATTMTQDAQTYQSDANLRGSLVFVGGHFDLSNTSNQSFGLVRVTENGQPVRHARVFVNDMQVGQTGWAGTFFLRSLQPYKESRVRVEHEDPMSGILWTDSEQIAVPRVREGVLFDIRVVQARGATGFLMVDTPEGRRPLQSMEFRIDEEVRLYPTAPDGEFYIDSLKVGRHVIQSSWKNVRCRAEITVTQSEGPFAELGEVVCAF